MIWLLLFPALFVPLFLCGAVFSLYPQRKMVWVLSGLCVLSFTAAIYEPFVWPMLCVDALVVLLFIVDAFTVSFRPRNFKAERQTKRIVSLSKRHEISLRIENRSGRSITARIRDDVHPDLAPDPLWFEPDVLQNGTAEVFDYQIYPKNRGSFLMNSVYFSCLSRLGFWNRLFSIPCETELHVYPDLQQITQYELLARTNRLYQLGVRKIRKVGLDNDFERLRDYQLDDNYKQISWNATARRNRLTVKDFQAQRNQRIVFMIDCGRMMTNMAKGLTLLDHSFNAMLMLAYVALRQGDSVGLLCFAEKPLFYVPPKSGQGQMNRLLHVCYDTFPEHVESRYDEAFYYLSAQCRKRSLVVLITNVNDEVNATMVQKQLTNLVGKHLPLGILLRDRQMFAAVNEYDSQATQTNPKRDPKFWSAAAAAQILNWRKHVIDELALKGTLTLDTFPDELTAPLINKYLEIKARQLL